MLQAPLFYLTLFLEVFVIILPRLIEVSINHIMIFPEFAKVRGKV